MRWHKLGAQATVCLRLHAHPSQTEAAFCDHLYLERRAACGAVEDYCYRPAKIDLGSGITWQLDFHVWMRTGEQYYVDVKGFETEAFKLKRRMYEEQRRVRPDDMKPLLIVKGRKGRRGYAWTREWIPPEAGRKHKRIRTPVIERR